MCDNPKCAGNHHTPEELHEQLMDRIMQFGHQVNYIFPGDGGDDVCFSYSVGRSIYENPELLITGNLPSEVHRWVINEIARRENEGTLVVADVAASGELLDEVLRDYPVRIVGPVDPEASKMFMAMSLSPNVITAYQILWPDKAGRWPEEPEFEYGGDAQPVVLL